MSPAPGSALAVEGVAHRFRSGVTALEGVDLAVAPGEFVSLLGPSGCGKSTLLRVAAGLTTPSSGSVHREGSPGNVAFVFQEPTLLPWATVADNVHLPLRLLRRPDALARVAEALTLVGLDGFAAAWPRQLSGGMRMRVSIARALVTHPRVLLLDEPFAALDEITRQRLNDDLRRLWRAQGFTALFVTHSVFEAVYLSTRVVVMSPRPGRLVADLPVDLPAERTQDLRLTPEYAAHCRRVSASLAATMGAA